MTVIVPSPLSDLAASYPGWHIWRGRDRAGCDRGWYATRRRRLPAAESRAGLQAALSADDPASLGAQLAQQGVIEARVTGTS